MDPQFNISVANITDPGMRDAVRTAFLKGFVPREMWRLDIIKDRYIKCHREPELQLSEQGVPYCPRIFDGWSCWNYSKPGSVDSVECPYFVTGMVQRHQGFRTCLPNGQWFRHPFKPDSPGWSNYTTCIDRDDLRLRQLVNTVYLYGYSLSLAAILISLLIFLFFRTPLNSTRVRIHANLFISFLINNVMWMIWYEFIVDDVRLLNENPPWCIAIHIVVQYFMVANYFWMFCEGLYLHTLLAVAFVTEGKLMKWLYLIGWVGPIIFILIYALVKGMHVQEIRWCWMEETGYRWLLSAPVCVSMIANFIFLVRIVWILVRKLRASPGNEDHNNSWRAVRATLILIPLLGLNYMLTPFRPEPGDPGEDIFQVLIAVTISIQGFFVALLFCFINGEVLQQFKKKWQQMRIMQGKPTHNSYAFTTMSTVQTTDTSLTCDLDPDKVKTDKW